ncbi:Isochorismatase-like protein [Rhexocercosporidium sp. MPI-PUGE-AT-0058]|nr:Isochorismatase-like protein [Rhexocercosporidium sp. MPI-PUGE-AT-0058]
MSTKTSEPPILLLIDIQHGLVEGPASWGPRSTPKFTENVAHLLQVWRSKSWPILHVHHDSTEPDNPISSKFPETYAPHSSAAPEEGERTFIKNVGSPFVATELPDAIESYGDRRIIVVGMDGSECINSTTRHGADLGYRIVVVADACASYGMADWITGQQRDAEETHRAAMGMLKSYAHVTSTENLMKTLGYEQ